MIMSIVSTTTRQECNVSIIYHFQYNQITQVNNEKHGLITIFNTMKIVKYILNIRLKVRNITIYS